MALLEFLADLNSVARQGERGLRTTDLFSTVREGEGRFLGLDPNSMMREGEMQMAMAGGIKPTATDLGWPEDMGDEDKALLIYLMMNHSKIKGGPNPFLDPSTGVPALLKYKHFGSY